MAKHRKDKGAKRDPRDLREGQAKSGKPSTPRSRDESMNESGKDDFQNPRSSGTTSLGGESSGGSTREPGGVEGADGSE
ncbi:MAG TPA: hypothetical protein VGJ64_01605 [Gemmatimonadaceae bacterium]|jgi:hypothetical protein